MQMSVSLDGCFEGPDREIDWHLADEEPHLHMNERLKVMGGFLTGRVGHELMTAYRPTAGRPAEQPRRRRVRRDPARHAEGRLLADAGAGRPEHHDRARRRGRGGQGAHGAAGGDLALGGAGLAASFLRLGLVDEFRIYVHPVLGRGRSPFPDADTLTALPRTGARTFGNGVVLLRYERAEA